MNTHPLGLVEVTGNPWQGMREVSNMRSDFSGLPGEKHTEQEGATENEGAR